MSETRPTCEDCLYYDFRTCRYNPPSGRRKDDPFPHVDIGAWCGKFQLRGKAPRTFLSEEETKGLVKLADRMLKKQVSDKKSVEEANLAKEC